MRSEPTSPLPPHTSPLHDVVLQALLLRAPASRFATNLKSFAALGKAHKLHNAIDHGLAGVARQARVALDFIIEGERAVDRGSPQGW